ncbi:MAG TPA: HAD family hydrolase [Candidatus Thermoplasmatota archaeon]|nr:HAD family hydrolase [Candidatus Thermoplasmatota archaeon]
MLTFEDGWRPRAILFDLDDTLLRSSEADALALERTVARFHEAFNGLTVSQIIEQHADLLREVRDAYHRTGTWAYPAERLSRLLARAGGDPSQGALLGEHYTEARLEALAPYEGVGEFLEALRAAGLRLGLLSNGSGQMQRRVLLRFRLAPYFDPVVLAGEVGLRKPDPAIFEFALGQMGFRPEEVLMVGDSYALDVLPALQLGMRAVHVAGGPGDARSHLFHRPGDPLEGPCTLRVGRVTELAAFLAR